MYERAAERTPLSRGERQHATLGMLRIPHQHHLLGLRYFDAGGTLGAAVAALVPGCDFHALGARIAAVTALTPGEVREHQTAHTPTVSVRSRTGSQTATMPTSEAG